MLDALEVVLARPAHHAEDRIALLEQELGEVRAVLARDACDQRTPASHASPESMESSPRDAAIYYSSATTTPRVAAPPGVSPSSPRRFEARLKLDRCGLVP